MIGTMNKKGPLLKTQLRKGDTVRITVGREKGKEGKILQVFRERQAVLVEGLNLIKKATKPNPKNQKGGIVEKEGFISISNVMMTCPKCDQPVRLATNVLHDGKKLRICRRCGDVLGS